MADPTTTNLVLSVPVRGSDVGVWDTPVNGDFNIIDAVAGSVTSKSLTNADVTLSLTESQVSILRFSGTLTGNVVITLGAIIKSWICENNTTGSFTLQVRGSSIGPTFVGLPPGSCQIYWDGTSINFVNLGRVGEYWDYAGATVPLWVTASSTPPYLHCNGGTFSAVTYPQLNAILGTTTLPDSRARMRIPLDGGTNRVTSAGSGVDGATRFAAGGFQSITLDTTMIPAHAHGVTDPGHDHAVTAGTTGQIQSGSDTLGGTSPAGTGAAVDVIPNTTGISIQNTGGGLAHNNMPPAYVGGITLIRAA
jgi:microcystin-dependent protein